MPLLFASMFPSWFAGIADAAIIIGAVGFALELNKTFSINLRLLRRIWILQTFRSVVVGLYTRWFHRAALILGWLAGLHRRPGSGAGACACACACAEG